MKKISDEQVALIQAVSAEGKTAYPPAALEKDLHLTEILKTLPTFHQPGSSIVFGGGTSLVKGYQLFNRISEDLDFKLLLHDHNSKSQHRVQLSRIRTKMVEGLNKMGYLINNLTVRNESRYFSFDLNYQNRFEPIVSLRPTIKLEFMQGRLYLLQQVNPIKTLLTEIAGNQNFDAYIPCVSLQQITAEKVISFLLRRYPADPTEFPDPRLVRHLHDVYFLLNRLTSLDDVITVFKHVVTEDAARYRNQIPELSTDPIGYLSAQISRFSQDQAIANDYQDFVTSLTLGTPPDIQRVKEAFLAVTNRCLTSLT